MSGRESAPLGVIAADDAVANAARPAAFETRLVGLTARYDVALASGDEAAARAVRDELLGIHSDKLAQVDEALCRYWAIGIGDRAGSECPECDGRGGCGVCKGGSQHGMECWACDNSHRCGRCGA